MEALQRELQESVANRAEAIGVLQGGDDEELLTIIQDTEVVMANVIARMVTEKGITQYAPPPPASDKTATATAAAAARKPWELTGEEPICLIAWEDETFYSAVLLQSQYNFGLEKPTAWVRVLGYDRSGNIMGCPDGTWDGTSITPNAPTTSGGSGGGAATSTNKAGATVVEIALDQIFTWTAGGVVGPALANSTAAGVAAAPAPTVAASAQVPMRLQAEAMTALTKAGNRCFALKSTPGTNDTALGVAKVFQAATLESPLPVNGSWSPSTKVLVRFGAATPGGAPSTATAGATPIPLSYPTANRGGFAVPSVTAASLSLSAGVVATSATLTMTPMLPPGVHEVPLSHIRVGKVYPMLRRKLSNMTEEERKKSQQEQRNRKRERDEEKRNERMTAAQRASSDWQALAGLC